MAIPPIKTCIVCEGARAEVHGKWTLLGFFGVAPDVRVSFTDFSKPVTLCFAFIGGDADGKIRAGLRVIAPSGAVIPGAMETEGDFVGGKISTAFFMSFQAVVPGPGRYTVVLTLNGQDSFKTTVELVPGTLIGNPNMPHG